MTNKQGGLPVLFIATCVDRPHSEDKRKENRPAHLAYLNGLGARVKIGGAVLGPDHQAPVGSMIIFEGDSEDASLGSWPRTLSRSPDCSRASA